MARVLITGASRGIGRATVIELASRVTNYLAAADVIDAADVASAVADALGNRNTPLRVPVGRAAYEMLAAARAATTPIDPAVEGGSSLHP